MSAAEKIVSLVPFGGDGEHKLAVLTSEGRLFERRRDHRAVNYLPGEAAGYDWRPVKTPEGKVVALCPFVGDGALIVLMADGRLFERSRIMTAISHGSETHTWLLMKGPLGE